VEFIYIVFLVNIKKYKGKEKEEKRRKDQVTKRGQVKR